MDIKNKVILITGASSGIGWATAEALAREGARLALAARRQDRLDALAQTLHERHGTETFVVRTDVKRENEVRYMITETVKRFGRLDVLINNAGVLFMGQFLEMPLVDMHAIMDTNYWSIVHAVKFAAPPMSKQGGGHIINIASGVSRRGLPFMAAYSASKYALAGLTEAVRLELAAQNIKFTTVYPGGVETEMPKSVDRKKLPPTYPDQRRWRISAERVARAVVKAVRKQPVEIFVPWWVGIGPWINLFSPALADRLIRRAEKI
ncbi:MAG TPA: SDR family oxidoreductase [Elusimicrobiota bacterium]|nr:SDR family oxidoreductase [Elusimicrobiota bacterium]